VVSSIGGLLEHAVIYPEYDKEDSAKNIDAKTQILKLMQNHKVEYLAIGNGTGGREIFKFITSVIKAADLKNIKRMFVNEAGASVYSTDAIAREEFPDLDPTIRSAVSIARRMQDPLAELVKIDPRSIGVGQYQHDVNVTKLKSELEQVVESCVNKVGVNLNAASKQLLSYVSGIGPALASQIVEFRQKAGAFVRREQLLSINGFGAKAFVQAAGFLRIPEGEYILDRSGVHPESYTIVEKMAKDLGVGIADLVQNNSLIDRIPLENYITATIGLPTLVDIIEELKKPGRDPRDPSQVVEYRDDVCEITDLKIDMTLKGVVTNVTDFGAFVDIGVHQDGLVHKSELSDQFVKDPHDVVKVGDILNLRVIEVDTQKKRIGLSCKAKREPVVRAPEQQPKTQHAPRKQHPGQDNRSNRSHKPRPPQPPSPRYTMDDLLSKFNRKV
jgi:protein Tex